MKDDIIKKLLERADRYWEALKEDLRCGRSHTSNWCRWSEAVNAVENISKIDFDNLLPNQEPSYAKI